ncbi:FAD-dependent oxidoreductase [Streptomyces lavendulocolor]|uniref:FAD-dependent oxidoreductase n=1 Tax=Streptomyces lavendulocolor TaxID=67316 RepID=UPI003C2ECDE3
MSAWHLDPHTLGAYAMWPVGYLHRYAGYEGTAQGNVHIGGEHCSYDFQGFMEGGATEGERAAREVSAACQPAGTALSRRTRPRRSAAVPCRSAARG